MKLLFIEYKLDDTNGQSYQEYYLIIGSPLD